MRLVACLGLLATIAGCNSNVQARSVSLDPRSTTNRLVVEVDEERKISVRENGAILWQKGTPARIDERGRIIDRNGQLLAWLHNDNVRLRGGGLIPIRTGVQGDIFLAHKAQRDAGLEVLEARVGKDGSIVPGEGRPVTMHMKGDRSLTNRRLALLLLLLLHNDMLGGPSQPSNSTESDDDLEFQKPDSD